jgi:intracellular multiplication protein IcmO
MVAPHEEMDMPADGTLHHATEAFRSLLTNRSQFGATYVLLAGTSLVSPAWAMASALFAVALGLARAAFTRADLKADRASRPYVLGYAWKDNEEIRVDRRQAERNFLILGVTGSGKTESLIGLADSFLDKGSGMAFLDGKGDPGLFRKISDQATMFSRNDDVLHLDLMFDRDGGRRSSHTFNPFAHANREQLYRLLSVISVVDEDDDLRVRGKLTTFLSSLAASLCFLRDKGALTLSPGSILDHLTLRGALALNDADGRLGLPASCTFGIERYLKELEGYDTERGLEQPATTQREHETLTGPLVTTLTRLAKDYGHVFETQTPDIDVQEVATHRRILVVTLHALERTGDESARIARIVTAALETIEMPRAEGRPLQGRAPFLIVLDEVGHYLTPGIAASAARAPETGTCWMFAAQDVPGFKRSFPREAQRVVDICETKLFMRTEEMEVTGALAVHRDGATSYRGVEDSPDILDLKGFGAGDMLVMRPEGRTFAKCVYRSFPGSHPQVQRRVVHLPGCRPARDAGKLGSAA